MKDRILVVVDPVSCGSNALERAMEGLEPNHHLPTLLVVAKAPDADGGEDAAISPEFAYADSALSDYRRAVEARGFSVEGWVTPDRREQMRQEIEASGPYSRALAVSPSGTWRRLVKRDLSEMLETAGIQTELHCS